MVDAFHFFCTNCLNISCVSVTTNGKWLELFYFPWWFLWVGKDSFLIYMYLYRRLKESFKNDSLPCQPYIVFSWKYMLNLWSLDIGLHVRSWHCLGTKFLMFFTSCTGCMVWCVAMWRIIYILSLVLHCELEIVSNVICRL